MDGAEESPVVYLPYLGSSLWSNTRVQPPLIHSDAIG